MAVRSGAGTGVVVSLVVFVLTTVFLLVLTIVFYAGKSKEMEEKYNAQNTLAVYVKSNQRNSETFKGFEAAAKAEGKSVAEYLNRKYEDMMNFVGAEPAGGLEKLKGEMARFNLKDTDTIRSRMQDMHRDLNARQNEVQSLTAQLTELNEQIAQKEAQLKQAEESNRENVEKIDGQIAQYRDAAEDYRKRLETAIDDLNRAKDTLRSRYEDQIRELNDENDDLNREMGILRTKIDMFESARADQITKASNPAMMVDAKIIDAPSSSDQVFIDRGKKDRIVLGMTFEVYSDPGQIRIHEQTGEIPRGKASLQVIKVADTTATCKITRSVPGQPVVRGDVVANAVYDPAKKFKFMVHGKFDVDGDGKPTEPEADYVRSLVLDWGGSVISGEDLPGDLDFLVLGAEPTQPPPPPQDASAIVIADWVRKNEAHVKYSELFRQAREAQIPVLNSNRFFILIGHVDR